MLERIMKIEEMTTEELIAQLGAATEEFAVDLFDRWCISRGVGQGEHVVHGDWIYKLYEIDNRRNPKRYKLKAFLKRLSKNLKTDGDNYYCNTSLDAFKRVLREAGIVSEVTTSVGLKNTVIALKRFLEAADIKDGDEAVRIDKFYNIYLDYCKEVKRVKKYSLAKFEEAIVTMLKTKTTINHVWVMINPDYKKEFHDGKEAEEQTTEGQVSSIEPISEPKD